jgi:hypothetical protein
MYLWAGPVTLLGLLVGAVTARGGRWTILDGVVEIHSPLLGWCLRHLVPVTGGVSAMTLGHVVVGRDADALDRTRTHERVHVRQYERLGPLLLPAYAAASVWAVLRGQHAYFDNCFEREARRRSSR